MEFEKTELNRNIRNKSGVVEEIFDLHLKLITEQGETLEDTLASLHSELDRRFAQSVRFEAMVMPERLREAQRWIQTSLFADLLTGGGRQANRIDSGGDNDDGGQ